PRTCGDKGFGRRGRTVPEHGDYLDLVDVAFDYSRRGDSAVIGEAVDGPWVFRDCQSLLHRAIDHELEGVQCRGRVDKEESGDQWGLGAAVRSAKRETT